MLAGVFVTTDSAEISGSKMNLQEILGPPFFRRDFGERNDKTDVIYSLYSHTFPDLTFLLISAVIMPPSALDQLSK